MAGKFFVKCYKRGFHWGRRTTETVTCELEVRKWREKCPYKSKLEDPKTLVGEDNRTQDYADFQHGERWWPVTLKATGANSD